MEKIRNSILKSLGKTPKVQLSKICKFKQLNQPTWLTEAIEPSPAIFKSTCSVEGFPGTGTGFGTTLHEAEQNSAKEFLKLIDLIGLAKISGTGTRRPEPKLEEMEVDQPASSGSKTNGDGVDNDPISDTDDDLVDGDPIGKLVTVCSRNNLPRAVFKDEDVKKGPENTNIFVVSCSIEGISRKTGRRNKKKDSKKIAAVRVLQELQGKGLISETILKSGVASLEDGTKNFRLPNQVETNPEKDAVGNQGQEKIMDPIKEFLDPIKNLCNMHGGHIVLFEKEAQEYKIHYRYKPGFLFDESTTSTFLELTIPEEHPAGRVFVVHGVGNSTEAAKEEATLRALVVIKMLFGDSDAI